MIVREASLADVKTIARVHVDTWRTTYRRIIPTDYLAKLSYQQRENSWSQILSSVADTGQFVFVAEDESGQIVGFASGGSERTSDPVYKGELYAIYILETYQRMGIGCQLILSVVERFALSEVHSMLAWVLADNPACRFYEALGGQKVYEKQIERGRVMLNEVAYGWTDTKVILAT